MFRVGEWNLHQKWNNGNILLRRRKKVREKERVYYEFEGNACILRDTLFTLRLPPSWMRGKVVVRVKGEDKPSRSMQQPQRPTIPTGQTSNPHRGNVPNFRHEFSMHFTKVKSNMAKIMNWNSSALAEYLFWDLRLLFYLLFNST